MCNLVGISGKYIAPLAPEGGYKACIRLDICERLFKLGPQRRVTSILLYAELRGLDDQDAVGRKPSLDCSIELFAVKRQRRRDLVLVTEVQNDNVESVLAGCDKGLTVLIAQIDARIVECPLVPLRQKQLAVFYEFTVDAPKSFASRFTGQYTMRPTEGPMFEYACHEGNYAKENTLKAIRHLEAEGR